ncbi:MAG: hypothetical protein RL375_4489, partial [Pseudomonadota bacterium]
SPCLLKDAADVSRLAEHLGKSEFDTLLGLSITKADNGDVLVRPKKARGRCEFHVDNRCSVHEAKPSGGADFECWSAERTAEARTAMFTWKESDLMACIDQARNAQ